MYRWGEIYSRLALSPPKGKWRSAKPRSSSVNLRAASIKKIKRSLLTAVFAGDKDVCKGKDLAARKGLLPAEEYAPLLDISLFERLLMMDLLDGGVENNSQGVGRRENKVITKMRLGLKSLLFIKMIGRCESQTVNCKLSITYPVQRSRRKP